MYEKCVQMTIRKFHKMLLNKEITCQELVKYYLDRIEKYDKKGACLNSIIYINPNALTEAEKLDEEIKENWTINKPLFGVPVILKDNVNTSNMPTTAGSKSLIGFIPDEDAFLVRKLYEAGAIILAKSNLHEFAIWGETISSVLGQTLNPYDLTRTPGGSSGGTGAAIAADMGLVGIGTDTINSIRSPASACSLVGIRPTIGMVSRTGIVPYSLTQDTAGPICRTVDDAAKVLDVIKGYDSLDEITAWCVDKIDMDYDDLNQQSLSGYRIGILDSFFGIKEEHKEVNDIMNKAIVKFKELGVKLININEKIDSIYMTKEISLHLYDLKDHLNKYLNSLPKHAPVHSLEEIIESGNYHSGIEENLRQAMAYSTGTVDYNKRLILRQNIQNKLMKIMADYMLDAIIYPHQQQLVCKVGLSQKERNGVLCSVTGFPSISIPAGYTDKTVTAPVGIPVGMEIIGRPWSEKKLIKIAYNFEQYFKVRRMPVLD